MWNLVSVLEFSHSQCVGICAVLIPAILSMTSLSLWLVYRQLPLAKVFKSVIAAIFLITLLLLHVASWWFVGVITPISFILLGLSVLCLTVNLTVLALKIRPIWQPN